MDRGPQTLAPDLLTIGRELAKQELVVHAARIVQIWWKRRQIQRGTDSAQKKIKASRAFSFDVWKIKQQFKRAQRQVAPSNTR